MLSILNNFKFPDIILLFLGKYDILIYALATFIAVELITVALVSIVKYKNLDRLNTMLFSQKLLEFLLVGIGHIIDLCISDDGSTFRTIIIWFYIGYEGIVILSNAIKLGLPVPPKLKEFLEQLLYNNENIKDKHDN